MLAKIPDISQIFLFKTNFKIMINYNCGIGKDKIECLFKDKRIIM